MWDGRTARDDGPAPGTIRIYGDRLVVGTLCGGDDDALRFEEVAIVVIATSSEVVPFSGPRETADLLGVNGYACQKDH